ncbi:MAG TPA: PIN/TRAM domain-containing protein [Clostridiales bacterium]|nr:PIN/TRAM domain-containing protein [Clostridiales bacterium]
MVFKIVRVVMSLIGALIGYGIGYLILSILTYFNHIQSFNFAIDVVILATCSILGGIIVFIISYRIIKTLQQFTDWVEKRLQEIPTQDIFFGVIGLTVALIIASLLMNLVRLIPVSIVSTLVSIFLYLVLGYFGINIAVRRRDELAGLFKRTSFTKDKSKSGRSESTVQPKILDTSVIIDGRIFDICKTGFVEGPLIIPSFVLEELRHIADSSDTLKRNRGRRGLDILNKIQKELDIEVQILEKNFPDSMDVDTRLLKLGEFVNGKVITNDYNLNKVAEFRGVEVLNINELANAVKPVVLPGEEMVVQVIRDGKESGQGVAYLDDGTMIVVDGGKKHVGKTIDVLVTSVLQTAAGRMIFAKPKSIDKAV